MRQLKLKAPIDTETLEGFLFFVQALDEQLYDFTDDSYKAPALNTFTRTLELQSLATLNHKAGRGKDALLPYVEELEWSIRNDAALSVDTRALCQLHVTAVRETLAEPDRIARGLAGIRIALGDYFEKLRTRIIECVSKTPKHKDSLTNLSAAFIVQAEVGGFPRRHTYHTLQKSILRKLPHLKSIDAVTLLTDFFSYFDFKESDYSCIFLVPEGVKAFVKLREPYEFEILDEEPVLESPTPQQAGFLGSKSPGLCFIKFNKIPAPSPVSAHEICTGIFSEFMSVVRYVEHKLDFSLSKLALVVRTEDQKAFIVKDSPDPMHCWSAAYQAGEPAMLRLVDVLHGPHLTDESGYRLRRAVRYHGTALRSASPENQLVDLWAALEGILAQPRRDSKRIEFFAENMLPALTLTYPEKLLRSLFTKLTRYPRIRSIIESEIPTGSNDFARFVHLLICQEYEVKRSDMLAELTSTPLLRNRAFRVAQSLGTRSAALKTLKSHREKVRWHIDRIYATRNSIMHNATALPYLSTLVENLHVYIDTLVDSIGRVAVAAHEPVSVESVLQYIAAWEQHRFDSLATGAGAAKQDLTSADVWQVVFGTGLALAPDE
ncbi:HEPN domain-containing protein [Methylibium petroleiphilum]|uniref:HEPN domain-containing protein n=1 Tax=Methylibium petroleiphilum TaxID=105560 RepID=UPI001AD42DBD|nr:HEPN domain-containing protein [Methylibium petroleiphilum]MBN9204157.1 hypothetical protein [Methylibium petroleiphilum]